MTTLKVAALGLISGEELNDALFNVGGPAVQLESDAGDLEVLLRTFPSLATDTLDSLLLKAGSAADLAEPVLRAMTAILEGPEPVDFERLRARLKTSMSKDILYAGGDDDHPSNQVLQAIEGSHCQIPWGAVIRCAWYGKASDGPPDWKKFKMGKFREVKGNGLDMTTILVTYMNMKKNVGSIYVTNRMLTFYGNNLVDPCPGHRKCLWVEMNHVSYVCVCVCVCVLFGFFLPFFL